MIVIGHLLLLVREMLVHVGLLLLWLLQLLMVKTLLLLLLLKMVMSHQVFTDFRRLGDCRVWTSGLLLPFPENADDDGDDHEEDEDGQADDQDEDRAGFQAADWSNCF